MAAKPKTQQPATPGAPQERDQFQTPDYGTDLIVPYLAKLPFVWEPACGGGMMVRRLKKFIHCVVGTSIETGQNFLEPQPTWERNCDCIVTNPPYSLKAQFVNRCMEIGKPWALLVPVDMAGWNLDAIEQGCQWLIPRRRIDYITPNILKNIREGEVWKLVRPATGYKKLSDYKKEWPEMWAEHLADFPNVGVYATIGDVSAPLLDAYSASQFHSGWLTFGLNLPKQVTVVDLPLESKKRGYILETRP